MTEKTLHAQTKDISEAEYLNYRDSSLKSIHDYGLKLFYEQDYDRASRLLTITVSKEKNRMSDQDKAMLAEAHNALGVINFTNANYAGAYTHFLRAIKLYDVEDAPGYANLAAIYLYYGDVPRAYDCLRRVFKGAVRNAHGYHASMALVNILTIDPGSSTIPPDSIKELISEFKSLPPELRDKKGYPVANALADAYILSHSNRHLDSAVKLKGLLGNLGRMVLPARDIHSVYSLIAKEYSYVNMMDSALAYLDRAQYIASVNDFKELLATTYRDKAILLSENGRKQEAESFRIKMLELNDSLFNPRELGKIRDIQVSYQIDSFEKELNEVKMKEQMWRIILYVVLSALIILLVMMVIIIRKNKAIRDKNRHLFIRKRKDLRVKEEATGSTESESLLSPTGNSLNIEEKDAVLSPAHTREDSISEFHGSPEAEQLATTPPHIYSENEEQDVRRKYTSSALTDETRGPILKRINEVFEDESLFCQENFSLQTLAQLCDTNQKYVSQIINETMGQNFASLLNEKRINVACKRLMDVENYGNLTIEAIVSDLGFKSRSTFSKTFKRFTGLTPGEFQRLAKADKQADNL